MMIEIETLNDGFRTLVSTVYVMRGTEVLTLDGPVLPRPTRTSIQIGDEGHIEDKHGAFVNHSCNPTCKVEKGADGKWCLIAARDMIPGEWITFDYNQSETEMNTPFRCGSCDRLIAGRNASEEPVLPRQ